MRTWTTSRTVWTIWIRRCKLARSNADGFDTPVRADQGDVLTTAEKAARLILRGADNNRARTLIGRRRACGGSDAPPTPCGMHRASGPPHDAGGWFVSIRPKRLGKCASGRAGGAVASDIRFAGAASSLACVKTVVSRVGHTTPLRPSVANPASSPQGATTSRAGKQRLSVSSHAATDAALANSLWARSTPITLAAPLSRAPIMAANGAAGVS